MKKITAILLLTAYLFSITELHQLLKLPVVFQHYNEHKEWNSNISFLDFLEMHYMHDTSSLSDYADDLKLPFKAFDKCASIITPVIVPQNLNIKVSTEPVYIKPEQRFVWLDEFIPSSYLSRIWQPPRFC